MNKRTSANIYVIFSILLGYALSYTVAAVYPKGIETALLANMLNIVNIVVITVIPILLFALSDRLSFVEMFKKVPARNWTKYIFTVPVLWSSATYLNSRVNILLGKMGINMIQQLPPSSEPIAVIAGFILTCIAAPVLEEIFYRGVVLHLLKGYGKGAAVAVSAMLFALAHGSITVFVPPLVFGLVLGCVTLKSGSVFPAILMHFGCNLISWLLMSTEPGQTFSVVAGIATILIGASGTVWAVIKLVKNARKAGQVFAEAWGYIKNPLWLPVFANYIYINIMNHG